ncbi:MAG: hypothetical protein ACTSQI_05585 [Candidatus Helarchaeota archaeon]
MEKRPHKSKWKRQRRPDTIVERLEEKSEAYVEIMEKLQKFKNYLIASIALLILPSLIFLFIWGGIIVYIPIISLVVVVILVFFIYLPISDLLKKPPNK